MRVLTMLMVAALLGCGGSTNPPVGRCDGVRCPGSDTCDPATGLCRTRPSTDAGAADAGRPDGGSDGGADAGLDAGARTDAGLDAGASDAGAVDAGPIDAGTPDAAVVDAGRPECVDPQDCFGIRNRCEPRLGRCVECFEDSHCPSAIPKCDVVRGECVECLSNVDCQNPRPTCRARSCDDCLTPSECSPGQSCDLRVGDCLALPDSCAAPGRFTLPDGGGSTFVTFELANAVDDLTTSCGAGTDVVYALELAAVRDVTLTARLLGPGTAVPTVALRSGACSSGAELACDRTRDGGSAASLVLPGVMPGSYFVVVESPSGTTGRIELAVTAVAPATLAINDTCAGAEALTFFGTRAVTVGSTVLASNDGVGPSCSPAASQDGRDLAFTYETDGGANVVVTVRPLSGSALTPVVSVRPACVSAMNELGCVSAAAPGESVALSLPVQPAGRYAVLVDSATTSTGSFQLEVTRTPVVPNETCGAIQSLAFVGNVAAGTGDTTWAVNDNGPTDTSPSCSPSARSSGADVVFSYTLTQARDVTVSVTPTGVSPTFWPVLAVRSVCTNATTPAELACVSPNASVQARATLVNQPAGTYTVWVDSAAQTSGPFQLEVVTAAPTPPPSNDACTSPQLLSFVGNSAAAAGSTRQAANDNNAFDVSPTCSQSARQNGRDVVYAFSLSQAQDVTIEVTPGATSMLRPVLYVRRGSCTSQLLGDEVVCLERVGPARAVLPNLQPGAYFVFVDGAGGTSGDFQLTLTRQAPTPPAPNDECAGALPLSFVNDVATVTGTTLAASNSNLPIDGAPACGADFIPRRWGRDLVYSYALTAAHDVEVRVTSGSGSSFAPVTYVRGAGQCALGFAGNELACGASPGPGQAVVYLPNQQPGTYPLFVDSNSYELGTFTLQVRQLSPTLPPANDVCAGAVLLTLGAAPVTGNTTGAANDYSLGSTPRYAPACGNSFMDGRDVVYGFIAPTTGTFTVTVTPQGAFDPSVLQLSGACSAAQCVRSANAGGPGASEAITFSAVAGVTTFFVVDSVSNEAPAGSGVFGIAVR